MTTRTHSELACYRKCPRLWQYRYVERRQGLIEASSLSRGRRVHQALASWWGDGLDFGSEHAMAFSDDCPPIDRAMLMGYCARWERPHLADVRVNAPFRVNIAPGLDISGEVDAVGVDAEGRTTVVEHKTTSSSIEPGGQYWRRVTHVDPQVSIYSLAFPGVVILYDVLHVPAFRTGDVYGKSLDDMAENPGKYFQRAPVVRLEEETRKTVEDIVQQNSLMTLQERHPMYGWSPESTVRFAPPRNPDACFHMGRECEFFAACWQGKDIETYPTWAGSENAEVVKERWGDV